MKVTVLVTCAASKVEQPPKRLTTRSIEARTLKQKAHEWISRLEAALGDAHIQAIDLYRGAYWNAVLTIPEAARKGRLEPEIWICSAGYGLIPSWAKVCPYASTFMACHADAVFKTRVPGYAHKDARIKWWKMLAEWEGPAPGQPRTVTALAESRPDQPMLVIASAPYLQAMVPDLAGVRRVLASPENLIIMSCGGQRLGVLTGNLVPADIRSLQLVDGGSMRMINTKLGLRLLSQAHQYPLHAHNLRRHYKQLLDELGKKPQPWHRRKLPKST